MNTRRQRIALDTLTFDPAIWPRLTRDDARAQQLADVFRAGQELPPIKIQKGTTLVLGGWHTAAACRLIGETTYFAETVDVQADERLLFAYREDVAAALPYSDADVRSVARRLYEQRANGELPNVVKLARDLGRSDRTVAHWVEDLVARKQREIELKRAARELAVKAFRESGLSTRRIADLIGVSHTQVASDCQVASALHLADSAIVTEAHSLIHMALGQGATQAEMEAARDWLIAQTNPDDLARRERRRLLTTIHSDLEDCSERWPTLRIPDSWEGCEGERAAVLRTLRPLEDYIHELKVRLQ